MHIYVLGDSISVHYGPYLERALSGLAVYARKGGPDASGTDWENPTDANGGDSRLVLSFLRENLPAINTDILLLNCGLHDIRVDRTTGDHQVPPDEYRRNLTAAINLIIDHHIRPIWITTTPVPDESHNQHDLPYHRFNRDVRAFNHVASEVMAKSAVSSIDLYHFTQSLGPNIYIDHIHHPDPVRSQQAEFIARELASLINLPHA